MSEKKEKIIRVNNLIIHAQNVEIIDAENVNIKEKNIETTDNRKEDHPRRNPWANFWGWPQREEINELDKEQEKENFETEHN